MASKIISIIGCVMLLTACSEQVGKSTNELESTTEGGFFHFVDMKSRATIDVPSNFTFQQTDSDGQFFGYDRNHGDFSIQLYNSLPSKQKTNNQAPSCSPALTGASKTTELLDANGEAEWGRVDFWDTVRGEGGDERPSGECNFPPVPWPPRTQYVPCPTAEESATLSEDELQWLPCAQRQRDYEVAHDMYSVYALCSEKGGKTVVICISQVTKDEALAKQIFETFRWTK